LSLRDTFVTQREAKLAEAKAVVETAETEARDITDAELASVKEAREAADALDARISEIDAIAAAESRSVAKTTASVQVVSEPTTYRKHGEHSYFRDLVGVDEYVRLARASRVAADLLRNLPLPAGTDSINLPKITTGTAVAAQSSENSGFQNTDLVTASATSAVHTLGGIQVLSVQLLEQSPIAGGMDQVIIADLAADYARALESFVLTSDAAGKRGLFNVPSDIDVTYTDSTPTVAELYPKLADAIQQIHTQRFAPATAIVMHPRRWAFLTAALDDSKRPLIVPAANGRFNSMGAQDGVAASGAVGSIQGVDVYTSSLVPTNLGSGTNQDPILVFRPEDSILFEGTPRAEVFRETYANQGSVLVRMYNYVAIATERHPKSVAVINGTGLVAPTF